MSQLLQSLQDTESCTLPVWPEWWDRITEADLKTPYLAQLTVFLPVQGLTVPVAVPGQVAARAPHPGVRAAQGAQLEATLLRPQPRPLLPEGSPAVLPHHHLKGGWRQVERTVAIVVSYHWISSLAYQKGDKLSTVDKHAEVQGGQTVSGDS